jgi:aminoglycoside phosphotransferase (APT) family kinase protein
VASHLSTPPLQWAAGHLGSEVTEAVALTGGWTSTMLALTTVRGDRAVLRLMTNEPWRTHGAELTTREHETQLFLAETDLPAPRSIAIDAHGFHSGEAAHLMTLVPGEVDLARVDDASLTTLARVLAAVHDLRPAGQPRNYQSWAWSAKYVVPDWAQDRAAWERAFAVLAQDPPPYDGTFLHRDFQPRNVLWTGPAVTGIVDWVETSWGPAWLDVAHCRTNLAITHGTEVADRFGAAYERLTGGEPQRYFDVMDVVGFLPPPGRRAFLTDPDELRRLEQQLVSVLASL